MRAIARFCLICCVLFITAYQLPALSVEEEKPTPAPDQSEAPKPKTKKPTKSAATSEEKTPGKPETGAKPAPPPAPQGLSRFAGTWKGKINHGLLGHVTTLASGSGHQPLMAIRSLGKQELPAK
jgi:hypothetical protein